MSCVWLLKRQIAYQRETIFQRGCEPQPTIFFFQKKKNLWRLPRIATLISFSTTYIFCFFLEGYIFVNRVFSQKSSMTNGNEITDVFVFEGMSPPSPQNTLRERRVYACYQRLNSAPAGSGAAATAMRALHGLGAKQPAIGLAPAAAPLCGKGGAGAGPSGVENEEEEAKGRLGRGRASLTRNEAGSARMGLVLLFIQCTHGRASD